MHRWVLFRSVLKQPVPSEILSWPGYQRKPTMNERKKMKKIVARLNYDNETNTSKKLFNELWMTEISTHLQGSIWRNPELSSIFTENGKVVSLACGSGSELHSLANEFWTNNKEMTYLGVDLSKECIKSANAYHREFEKVTFILEDASNFDQLSNNSKFKPYIDQTDLVVLRHPEISSKNQKKFVKMMSDVAFEFLKPDGFLYISLHYDIEYTVFTGKNENNKLISGGIWGKYLEEKYKFCGKILKSDKAPSLKTCLEKAGEDGKAYLSSIEEKAINKREDHYQILLQIKVNWSK